MNLQISTKHRMLGIPYRPDIANLFPHAKQAGGLVIVPHGLHETKLLRNLGIDTPAPILTQYDWCGGRPFDVQRKTCAVLTTNQRAYVLNKMGTGKTKSALWAFDYLRGTGLAKRAIIVAPLSTLNMVWAREVFATVPHLKINVLYGSRQKRLDRLKDDADLYVINPDGLAVIGDALLTRADIDTVIIDELAMFRNPGAGRTKLMRKLAKPRTWVWGMTGAPTPNEPTDAWAQCSIVTPHTIPERYTHFRDEVMLKISNFKYVPKREANDIVFKAMQPAVCFSLDDVTELPDLIMRTVEVELGSKQEKVYQRMQDHAMVQVASKVINAANAGAVMNKLLQISTGYVYNADKEVVPLDNDKRMEALSDALDSTDRKCIVFVPFIHALGGISEHLTKEKRDFAVVSGDTPQRERDEIFRLFQQTDRYRVLLAHPQCMAHGLTLTAADTIIWFAPITSLEIFEQANARIRRVGQKHKQQVLMFQSTKVERYVYARLQQKRNVQTALLDMYMEQSA